MVRNATGWLTGSRWYIGAFGPVGSVTGWGVGGGPKCGSRARYGARVGSGGSGELAATGVGLADPVALGVLVAWLDAGVCPGSTVGDPHPPTMPIAKTQTTSMVTL
ncbi:hypothetical protein Raf01_65340 [Rugosimonospora africana]|uniref:Uncharacterized protein n=1 Tax=Rugosimonospora africana TaxID=556532 RepID=A0A8J3QYD3_9ACTN|nr:hypothetical protein Raf01_65340 [Rugosimonospora africana]